MRVKMISNQKQTLRTVADEFLMLKRAQRRRERTIRDYEIYIDKFIIHSSNSLSIEDLKTDLLNYFSEIPNSSPASYNHPYQYLHALFEWCTKQDYLPYNPFDKLDIKKRKDDGHVIPASIEDIQSFLNCLDKHNYCELRDYTITLLILDTGIRTSEIMLLEDNDYDADTESIYIRPEVAKTNRGRTIYLSQTTNKAIKRFLKSKPKEWEDWLFPTRDGFQLQSNVLARNFRKYCARSDTKFTPYQLRHSFATFYLKNGGDLFTLQKLMGHCDLQMTRRYTEISDDLLIASHNSFSPIGLLQTSTRKLRV